jgi:hypothetical protein
VLHLLKLSVGTRDVAHLRDIHAHRVAEDPPLRHRTRMMPRRAAQIAGAAGGSIYWVVSGFVQVRQRILEIRAERWEDGSACAGLVLDPQLVPVVARPVKPFQGWRYLLPEAAPPDVPVGSSTASGAEGMPPRMRQELHALGLL